MKPSSVASAPFSAEDIARSAAEPGDSQISQTPNPALIKLLQAMGHLDSRPPLSPVVLGGVTRLVEAALLASSGAGVLLMSAGPDKLAAGVAMAATAVLALVSWRALRLNALQILRSPGVAFARLIPMLAAYATVAVICLLEFGLSNAAGMIGAWFLIATAALAAGRLAIARKVASLTEKGRLERRVAVVGGGQPGEDLLARLELQSDPDLRILGVFDDRNDARSPMILAGYPKLGNVSDLVTFARSTRIDLIIFTLPITAEQRLLQMLKKLWVLPTDIRLAAHRNGLRFRPQSYSYVGAVPVLDMFDKPIADWDVVIKAIFDRVVGALALIALAPVLLLTALAIKFDSPGPVFFKQMRHGFNNEPIEVYKFRSLFADQSDFKAAKQVTKNDPRVTRVGRFIRRTSIDELPQLINVVFKGNLSLVGPRPHAVYAQLANKGYDDVVDGYFARHRVKPGITGWAQVNGWRGETDTPMKIQKRVEHDLAYIENWSIFFDIYILAITPWALTRTENAY